MKKLVPSVLSSSSMTRLEAKAGVAQSTIIAVMNSAQIDIGMRKKVIPGAR